MGIDSKVLGGGKMKNTGNAEESSRERGEE